MSPVIAGLTLVLSLAPAQPDPVEIRWKLTRGDTFYSRTVTRMKQTVEAAGMKMDQNQEQTLVHRYKVLEAGPKGFVIEQTITRAEIEGNVPMGAELAGRMKGAVLTYTLDDRFTVTKVDGFDKYLEKLSGDDEMTRKILETFVSEENLKLGVNDLFGFSPGKPVRAGDTWKREQKMSLGPLGSLELAATFKLAGVEDGVATIDASAVARYQAPKEAAEAGGLTIKKGELKTENVTGTLRFDTRAGRLRESRTEMKTTGTLTVAVGGADTEIGIDQTLTTTSTVSEKNLGDD